jgi:glycosyltransferase involved in cell wall biosynthesis
MKGCPSLDELPAPPPDKTGWPWTEESSRLSETMPEGSSWPKISIVTPSYNQGQFIEETIRSVLLQGYPNLEYIVMDGGSTDESVEIIETYDPWIDHWVSEKDRGQTHAINKGMKRCSGDIFNWINSDDLFAPGAFRIVAERLAEKQATVVCGYNRQFYDDTGKTAAHVRVRLTDTIEKTLVEGHFRQLPTFYRSDALRPLGELDESLDFVMDEELWLRYLLTYGQHQIIFTDEVLGHFRLHDSSKTVSQQALFQEELLGLMEVLRSVVEPGQGSQTTPGSKDGETHQALRAAARRRSLHDRRLLSYLYQNLAAHRRPGSRIESFVLIIKALLHYPFRSFTEYRYLIGLLFPEIAKFARMLRTSQNQ